MCEDCTNYFSKNQDLNSWIQIKKARKFRDEWMQLGESGGKHMFNGDESDRDEILARGHDVNVYQKYHDIESLNKQPIDVDMTLDYRKISLSAPQIAKNMKQAYND